MRTAAVLALVSAMTGVAHAEDDLARARRLEASLEYEQALEIVDRVIARGGADPARLAELHLLAGRLAAGLDRTKTAEDHFARVLVLRPDTALPGGTSPKLTAPFATARARSLPLDVRVTVVRGLVTLITARDALGLVAGISVHVIDGAGQHRDVVDRRALRLAIPAGTTAIEVAALDVNGNRVWVGAPPPEPVVIEPPPPPPPPRETTGLFGRWSTWAVITGTALAGGGVSAWRFHVAQREWDRVREAGGNFSRLLELEERGERWGLAANISFGVAAATGLTTAILWLRGGPDAAEPRLAIMPGPGAGIYVTARF